MLHSKVKMGVFHDVVIFQEDNSPLTGAVSWTEDESVPWGTIDFSSLKKRQIRPRYVDDVLVEDKPSRAPSIDCAVVT